MRNQTSPPQPIANAQRYYKLGGWLMFIFVYGIICAVNGSLSVISQLLMLLDLGSLITDMGLPVWITVTNYVLTMLLLVSCINFLIFLKKRHQKAFVITFISYWVLSVLTLLQGTLLLMIPGSPLVKYVYNLFAYSIALPADMFAPFLETMFNTMGVIMLVSLLICVALTIAWMLYLQRSKRVAVYFNPGLYPPYMGAMPQNVAFSYAVIGGTPQMSGPYAAPAEAAPVEAAPMENIPAAEAVEAAPEAVAEMAEEAVAVEAAPMENIPAADAVEAAPEAVAEMAEEAVAVEAAPMENIPAAEAVEAVPEAVAEMVEEAVAVEAAPIEAAPYAAAPFAPAPAPAAPMYTYAPAPQAGAAAPAAPMGGTPYAAVPTAPYGYPGGAYAPAAAPMGGMPYAQAAPYAPTAPMAPAAPAYYAPAPGMPGGAAYPAPYAPAMGNPYPDGGYAMAGGPLGGMPYPGTPQPPMPQSAMPYAAPAATPYAPAAPMGAYGVPAAPVAPVAEAPSAAPQPNDPGTTL